MLSHPRMARGLTPGTTTGPPTVAASHVTGSRQVSDRWVTAGLAALTLGVYLRSLMPGIGYSGDAAKWQMLSAVGGIPHATGYPLYVAAIQAFGTVVPFGSAAWKTNLFSAVCAVAAVALLYQLLRILSLRQSVAAATAATFAFTEMFWIHAVVAEVYALHILFIVSILVCLARWRLGANNRWLMAGIALLALSFGNHMTTILVVPSAAWLVWTDRRRALTLRNAVWAVVVGVLGASQYLYLLHLGDVGVYREAQVDNLRDIWAMVTGGPFKDRMLVFSLREVIVERVPLLWDFVRDEYGLLLAPIALGVWRGVRGWTAPTDPDTSPDAPGRPPRRCRRDIAIALVLLGLASAAYGLNYDVLDVIVYFMPLFLVLAVFLGIGLDGIVGGVTRRWPAHRRAALAVAGASLAAIPAVMGVVGYRSASQRGTTADAERIELALDAVGEHAVLLTDNYNDSTFFWYYLIGEGMADSRDLSLVHQATPQHVIDYFSGGLSPVADAAAALEGTDPPPLYTASPLQPEAMARAGLNVTQVAEGVWRVDQGDRHHMPTAGTAATAAQAPPGQ